MIGVSMSHDIMVELEKNDIEKFRVNEELIHKQMDCSRFYELMDFQYGINFGTISRYIHGGQYSPLEQQNFNIALREMKYTFGFTVTDAILFLEERFPLNKIKKFIDSETEWVLKFELSEKYSIDMEDNNLFNFMY